MTLSRSTYLAIALFHGAALMLQLLLTRVLAITVFYHFAFLVISLVMLGLSVAGLTVHLLAGRLSRQALPLHLTLISFATAASILVTIWLYLQVDWLHVQMEEAYRPPGLRTTVKIGLMIVLFFIPQCLIGLVSSLLLHHHPERAGKIYCADLIGAGIGCVVMIQGSKILTGFEMIVLTATVMAIAGFLFALPRGRLVAGASIGLAIMVGLAALQFSDPYLQIIHNKLGDRSPEDQVIIERWNPISRVTVRPQTYFEHSPAGPDLNEDGEPGFTWEGYWIDQDSCAGTPIFPWSGTEKQIAHLRTSLSGYAYQLASREEVFVIGVGGGKDLMTALSFGVETIHAAEINPSIAAVLQEDFANFTGHLYENPHIDVSIDEGRSSLLARDQQYDQIQLTFIDSFTPTLAGLSAMVENHLYTVEAFETYFDRLQSDGVLSIQWWNTEEMPAILARLYLTGTEALRARGIEDPTRHIIFVTQAQDIHGILVFREEPFSEVEARRAREMAEEVGLIVRAIPGETPSQPFIGGMVEASRPGGDLEAFLESLPIDIRPVTDDKPYIHFIHRPDVLDQETIEARVPAELHIYLLAPQVIQRLFWIVTLLCGGLIVLPLLLLFARHMTSVLSEVRPARLLGAVLYFTGLGAGFLLVEISLIHRFIVYLGHPLYATSVVLATLLIASGVGGGLLMHRKASPRGRQRRLLLQLLGIILLTTFALSAMPVLFEATRPHALLFRMTVGVIITSVFGLLMGTALPLGLEIMKTRFPMATPILSPWLWAINGAAGTFASVASILISVRWGFTVCLALGAACYLVCLLTAALFLRVRE